MTLSNLDPIALINIGASLCLLLFCIVFATWQAFRGKTKAWLWRLYAALIWIGLVLALYSDKFTNAISTEMPPEFAIGVWITIAGICATVVHCLFILIRRVRQQRPLQVG